MPAKKHLGTITILLKDRHQQSGQLQDILSQNSHLIMARLGVNPTRTCLKNCTGLIVLTVEGTSKEISDLTKKLDKLYAVVAKQIIIDK
ncbi:MAG: hypothetical protein PHO91_00640 [Patescibacteria group bacterium]|nr:hypothetical protein [Patescibacteria group bacterium]